mmetsp:Transcript_9640/g.39320  ORF Transcript_9640/g.39320 Transcript_9640/m.39320 type:complete len:731 (+) Transcript_9640:346-2538(+)
MYAGNTTNQGGALSGAPNAPPSPRGGAPGGPPPTPPTTDRTSSNSGSSKVEELEAKKRAKREANRRSAQLSRARKKAFIEDLKQQNQDYQRCEHILACHPDLIFSFDASGRVEYANRAASTQLGLWGPDDALSAADPSEGTTTNGAPPPPPLGGGGASPNASHQSGGGGAPSAQGGDHPAGQRSSSSSFFDLLSDESRLRFQSALQQVMSRTGSMRATIAFDAPLEICVPPHRAGASPQNTTARGVPPPRTPPRASILPGGAPPPSDEASSSESAGPPPGGSSSSSLNASEASSAPRLLALDVVGQCTRDEREAGEWTIVCAARPAAPRGSQTRSSSSSGASSSASSADGRQGLAATAKAAASTGDGASAPPAEPPPLDAAAKSVGNDDDDDEDKRHRHPPRRRVVERGAERQAAVRRGRHLRGLPVLRLAPGGRVPVRGGRPRDLPRGLVPPGPRGVVQRGRRRRGPARNSRRDARPAAAALRVHWRDAGARQVLHQRRPRERLVLPRRNARQIGQDGPRHARLAAARRRDVHAAPVRPGPRHRRRHGHRLAGFEERRGAEIGRPRPRLHRRVPRVRRHHGRHPETRQDRSEQAGRQAQAVRLHVLHQPLHAPHGRRLRRRARRARRGRGLLRREPRDPDQDPQVRRLLGLRPVVHLLHHRQLRPARLHDRHDDAQNLLRAPLDPHQGPHAQLAGLERHRARLGGHPRRHRGQGEETLEAASVVAVVFL